MPSTQVWLYSLMLIALAQTPQQSTMSDSKPPRVHMKQKDMCCYAVNVINPIYPRQARLTRTEGTVTLTMIVAVNGTVAELQEVSGDPLLRDSVVNAVRQWRLQPVLINGSPAEAEVPLTFTFTIDDPPKPAYLHLKNGDVIRADEVREFTDIIEYTVGHRTRHLSPDSVTAINACARIAHLLEENGCVPSGGPSFNIIALPLFAARKTDRPGRPASP